jgi:hypothetical protein
VWGEQDLLPTMRDVYAGVKRNSPSGLAGNNCMGSIHPRLKRPVGRRLAYAAARLLKLQQKQQLRATALAASGEGSRLGSADDEAFTGEDDGAFTGPTIAGCSYTATTAATAAGAGVLEIKFNSSLLGGEALLLRPFDANETGGWQDNPFNDSATTYHPYKVKTYHPTTDSLGLMVCTAEQPGVPGNASTCACQQWDFVAHNDSSGKLQGFWFCEVGGGPELWHPAADSLRPNQRGATVASNPFTSQWKPAPLQGYLESSVLVDLSGPALNGKTPLAVRLAWPLFGDLSKGVGGKADSCCPTRSILDGHGVCLPGNCPLYTAQSELPANPFFAVVQGGTCHCTAPQSCDA